MSLIFDIKRYAINDGPGIRITLFMKGCPLSCLWCHNPEGIRNGKDKLYTRKKCLGCGACVRICPNHALQLTSEGITTDKQKCTLCGQCAEECPALAIEVSGTEYTPEYLMHEIEKEIPFMDQSDGGVTFCGGEPLLHPDFLLDMLKRCGKLGIHRAVDTTLLARKETIDEVMQHCELLLIDLKSMDSAVHKTFCDVPNELILENIRRVAATGFPYYIRIPLISGVNADEENIIRSATFLSSLPRHPEIINLLPYHDIGKGKHEKLGTVYNPTGYRMATPSEEVQQRCIHIFANYGLKATIGG